VQASQEKSVSGLTPARNHGGHNAFTKASQESRSMNANVQDIRNIQAYRELVVILKKPYQDVCRSCEGKGKLPNAQICLICKGSGHRWLKLL
jgi:hypothetical protein